MTPDSIYVSLEFNCISYVYLLAIDVKFLVSVLP